LRIEDMLEAIQTSETLVEGLGFDAFDSRGHEGQRRGVERCIEIVSEASRHIPDALRDKYPHIPWRSIRDIGNVLRHGYSSVDNLIIWRIVTLSFCELKTALTDMLSQLPPETGEPGAGQPSTRRNE
jgi:uncharacterized protein with HEPN domain